MNDTPNPTDAGWLPGDVAAINSADIDSNVAVGEVIDALTANPSLAEGLLDTVTAPKSARGKNSSIVYLDELPFYAPNDTVDNVSLAAQVEEIVAADGHVLGNGPAVTLDDSLPIEADGEELPPLTPEQLATLENALALRGKSNGARGVLDFFKALELTGTPLTTEQESLYKQLKKMQKVFPQVHGKHVHIKKRQSKNRKKR